LGQYPFSGDQQVKEAAMDVAQPGQQQVDAS
jgi:hypothetical protein